MVTIRLGLAGSSAAYVSRYLDGRPLPSSVSLEEFGIRMALGATARDVLKLVLRQAAVLTVAATVGGVLVSLAVNRLLGSLLFGVKAADPLAGSIAVFTLALVAFSASYLPARRATKVDPIVALRYE